MRRPPIRRRRRLRQWRGLLVGAVVFVGLTAPRRAPATVEEQRARLPPAAECTDPVAGTWKSHSYDERYVDWTIFTLEVKRKEPGSTELVGTIVNHTWYADKTQSQPGPCEGKLRYIVSMDAEGSVVDGEIKFGGIGQWRLDEVLCGDFSMGYNLDNFSGHIDPELHEFQSVNNDGGRAVNDPTVFRRVTCGDEEGTEDEGPRVAVAPPPFYPPEEESVGCGVL